MSGAEILKGIVIDEPSGGLASFTSQGAGEEAIVKSWHNRWEQNIMSEGRMGRLKMTGEVKSGGVINVVEYFERKLNSIL